MHRRFFLAAVGFTLAASALACLPHPAKDPEQLYFAVEVTEGGSRVGAPKLVGFAEHEVSVEKRPSPKASPEYQLLMVPHADKGCYDLALKLWLPSGWKEGTLKLAHGEEAKLAMGDGVELKVLLMRVDSPEFRLLMSDRPKRLTI
jgi:hypothetical protein